MGLFVDVGGGFGDQDYRFRGIGKGERGVQDSVRIVNIRVRVVHLEWLEGMVMIVGKDLGVLEKFGSSLIFQEEFQGISEVRFFLPGILISCIAFLPNQVLMILGASLMFLDFLHIIFFLVVDKVRW